MPKKEFQKPIEQSNRDKGMDLAAWRASHRHEMTLPSGLQAVIRDVDMTDLLLTGILPPAILQEAQKAAEITNQVDLQKMAIDLMEKDGPAFKALLDAIAKAAMLEPAIGMVADETHITIDELTIDDKTAIMEYVNREVEQIRSFRPGQDKSVAAVQPRDRVQEKAE